VIDRLIGRYGYVFPVCGFAKRTLVPHWGEVRGGSDLFAPSGTPVVAMIGGLVDAVGFGHISGNYVSMVGDDGLDYWYAHGDRPPSVSVGDVIETGCYLFGVGATGNADGGPPHLHLGIGYGIAAGDGPAGGCGHHFDAVLLLQRVLESASMQAAIQLGSDGRPSQSPAVTGKERGAAPSGEEGVPEGSALSSTD